MTVNQAIEGKLRNLRIWNIAVGIVLAVQAVLMAILTNNFSLPVTATFMEGPPGSAASLHHIWSIQTGWGVFAFMAISALALLLIASPWVFPWYKRNLLQNRNPGRWIEYFFSASIMIVLIAQITGISDIGALVTIFGINACMILFGALQEKYEKPGKPGWMPFWFGSFAGIIPWIAILVYLIAPGISATPPGFVYAIFICLFIFFNCFAVNMILQYKKIGAWKDYLYGEKVYILLSLTAKSLLAWLVFANILVL
ncbi:MAG: heliorhodopsin HeR [Dehalococcoidales bacterium]|nr:heliorhodopsin HeR [Dehalococcoidales bacterium]